MPASQPVTETIILHLKKGVNLENVASGTGADTSPAVQVFVQLTDTVKAQQGFIRQFWVIGLYLAFSMRKLKYGIGSSSGRSTHLCLVYR
jgi:hypothetical protein